MMLVPYLVLMFGLVATALVDASMRLPMVLPGAGVAAWKMVVHWALLLSLGAVVWELARRR
jgi:hypothetical protein